MKRIAISFIIGIIPYVCLNAQSKTDISGVWLAESNTQIEIVAKNGIGSGKILSSDNEKANVGSMILKDLKKDGDESWEGQIYSAKKEAWYDVEIEREGDELQLEVSVGFFSKSLTWKKVTKQ